MIPELASILCFPAGPRLRIDIWDDVQMCTLSFVRLVLGVGTDLWSKRHVSLYAVGPLVWIYHSDVPLLSAIVAISGFAQTFIFSVVSIGFLVFVTVPIRFAVLGAFCASLLSSAVSFATRPF